MLAPVKAGSEVILAFGSSVMAGIFSLQERLNAFLLKIFKGGECSDTFIGNTNHRCIEDELDCVVGLDPGSEGRIIISRRVSIRQYIL